MTQMYLHKINAVSQQSSLGCSLNLILAMHLANNGSNALVTFAEPNFGVVDYVVLAAFLCLSSCVGIFFSCRNQKTTGEYFFGSRQLSAVPVGISTGVSFLSATSIVGYSSESYTNGWSFMLTIASGSLSTFIGLAAVISVIHSLRVKSLKEYFERRFKMKFLSSLTSVIMLVCICQYMGDCTFGSVTAIAGATGGQVSIAVALVIGGSVGVFYTSIGGLKAVVWSDVLQFGFMLLGILIVIIELLIDTPRGLSSVLETNTKFGRFDTPPLSFDLTIRHSLWSVLIGGGIGWLMWCTQPAIVQRLVSLKTKRDCYIVSAITTVLYVFFTALPSFIGINLFGYYTGRGCDVLAAGWIKKNEIMTYFIRDRLSVPGFQGLFVAALFAGSLSSLSSGLNSASSIVWNDLLRPCFRRPPSEMQAVFISKIIVVIFGALSMMWCYILVSFDGMILQVGYSIHSSMYGSYLSLFLYAILFRYSNSLGAAAGMLFSFAFTLWLGIGSLLHGKSHVENLPTTTDNCSFIEIKNASTAMLPAVQLNGTSPQSFLGSIYSVSYLWLSSVCIIVFMFVSLLVTACTEDEAVDPVLLLPVCRPGYFRKCCRPSCERQSVMQDDEEFEDSQKLRPE